MVEIVRFTLGIPRTILTSFLGLSSSYSGGRRSSNSFLVLVVEGSAALTLNAVSLKLVLSEIMFSLESEFVIVFN